MCMVYYYYYYILLLRRWRRQDDYIIKTELKHFLGIYAGAINKLAILTHIENGLFRGYVRGKA
jgi:hypothetical protein